MLLPNIQRDYLLACAPYFALAFCTVPYFHICVTPSWIWAALFHLLHAIQCYKRIIRCICDSCKAYNVNGCLMALTRRKANTQIHIYILQTKSNARILYNEIVYTPSQIIFRQYLKHKKEDINRSSSKGEHFIYSLAKNWFHRSLLRHNCIVYFPFFPSWIWISSNRLDSTDGTWINCTFSHGLRSIIYPQLKNYK